MSCPLQGPQGPKGAKGSSVGILTIEIHRVCSTWVGGFNHVLFQGPAGPKGDTGLIGPPGLPVSIYTNAFYAVFLCCIKASFFFPFLLCAGSTRGGYPTPAYPVPQEDQTVQRRAVGCSRHGLRRGHGRHLWRAQQSETRYWAYEIPDGHTKQPIQNMQRSTALPPRVPWWWVESTLEKEELLLTFLLTYLGWGSSELILPVAGERFFCRQTSLLQASW